MIEPSRIPPPGGLPQSQEWDDEEYTGEGVYVPPDQAYPIPEITAQETEQTARREQFEECTEVFDELFGVTQRGQQ